MTLRCYRCDSADVMLAPLWPEERKQYAISDIVMRQCQNCGLEQNHFNHDEPLTSALAAESAPSLRAYPVDEYMTKCFLEE